MKMMRSIKKRREVTTDNKKGNQLSEQPFLTHVSELSNFALSRRNSMLATKDDDRAQSLGGFAQTV